ncbi:MAG: U32 family peptidase [Anaerolineales bacterium]|nr:U32 family peptidase [Anaerolineales bacterium]
MSPAGYWPQLHAAIEAGADAVYFGLKHFSARAKVGFALEELPEAIKTLHRRGVKGYVTFNTLIFDHELRDAARSLAAIAATGTDAIIVQDLAVARLARQIAPAMEVHGSTQMSITSAEGIALAQEFGVNRVVLARELSLAEVRAIRAQTSCELEIFVHGALCVSYSGQCFSSEAWGGRSANRGQCAQACRLPYELLVDGQLRPLGDARYLLSPGDLYALRQMPEIVATGVAALKIEGRYKDAEYVALTTAAYRQAVDEAYAGLALSITPQDELRLEQVYSRGLGPYFVTGTNHQTVVKGRAPRHRGVLMGKVTRVQADRVLIAPAAAATAGHLKPGDGLVFDAADWRSPELPEEGGRVYQVAPAPGGLLELQFGNGVVNFSRIRSGDLVWRSHDPALDKLARPYVSAPAPVHKQLVQVHVTARPGAPLMAMWSLVDLPEILVVVESAAPLDSAQQRDMTPEYLTEHLGRLGNTAYALAELTADIEGSPFAPGSWLNQLRRLAVERLQEQQERLADRTIQAPDQALAQALAAIPAPARSQQAEAPALHLLVRTPAQLDAALRVRPASITLDYLDLYGLRPAVERVRAAGIAPRVASPRILKPNEQRIVNFLLRLDCDILVRSAGLLQALQGLTEHALVGDFSLNAANLIAADALIHHGLTRLTPTHDLNAAQVADLATALGAEKFEAVAFQHLPVFHTEHCVFCRFLSTGTTYKDCGHPCEKHQLALRDNNGAMHPVMADVGCRNTVFGAAAQTATKHLSLWLNAGIRHYRLEFVHEDANQVEQISHAFTATLEGAQPVSALARRIDEILPIGTTEGSLFIADNYLNLPLMI